MTKQSITERPIHVYTCMTDPNRKCVALIDKLPMIFKGDTPMKAKQVADEWRREAVRTSKTISKARKAEILGENLE